MGWENGAGASAAGGAGCRTRRGQREKERQRERVQSEVSHGARKTNKPREDAFPLFVPFRACVRARVCVPFFFLPLVRFTFTRLRKKDPALPAVVL